MHSIGSAHIRRGESAHGFAYGDRLLRANQILLPCGDIARIDSVYAQYQTTLLQQLTLTGGFRHDDDSDFGGHNSVKTAAAWALFAGDTILRGNYGDGFKAPSLYELFSPYSNPVAKTRARDRPWLGDRRDQKLLHGNGAHFAGVFQRHTE